MYRLHVEIFGKTLGLNRRSLLRASQAALAGRVTTPMAPIGGHLRPCLIAPISVSGAKHYKCSVDSKNTPQGHSGEGTFHRKNALSLVNVTSSG